MTDQERRASEAARILEDVEPYLAQVEADLFASFLQSNSDLDLRQLRDRAVAVKLLRNTLKTQIELGKQAARPKMAVA
jgi:hypothetical protein